MNLNECINKRFVKKTKLDIERINSLIETANLKETTEHSIPFNEINSIAKISLRYDVLRGLLEALAILNNYKIYNHECYSAFLNQVLYEKDLSKIFNKVRIARNSINYYGKTYSINESRFVLENISIAIEKVRVLLNNKIL